MASKLPTPRAALAPCRVFTLGLLVAVAGPIFGQNYALVSPVVVLQPLINVGKPKFSTIEIGEIPANGVTTTLGVTTIQFTMPGQSTQYQLKLDPGFRWLIGSAMSANSLAAFKQVLETGVRDSNNYSVTIEGVFSYFSVSPNVYSVTGSSVLRFATKAGVPVGTNSVISGRFADVPSDANAGTTEFWGTLVIRTSSDKTYGLLRYNASYLRRGDPAGPTCTVTGLPLSTVSSFVLDALGRGAIDVLNHCTDPNDVRVIHADSGWL